MCGCADMSIPQSQPLVAAPWGWVVPESPQLHISIPRSRFRCTTLCSSVVLCTCSVCFDLGFPPQAATAIVPTCMLLLSLTRCAVRLAILRPVCPAIRCEGLPRGAADGGSQYRVPLGANLPGVRGAGPDLLRWSLHRPEPRRLATGVRGTVPTLLFSAWQAEMCRWDTMTPGQRALGCPSSSAARTVVLHTLYSLFAGHPICLPRRAA